jgi:hypothetical protein
MAFVTALHWSLQAPGLYAECDAVVPDNLEIRNILSTIVRKVAERQAAMTNRDRAAYDQVTRDIQTFYELLKRTSAR